MHVGPHPRVRLVLPHLLPKQNLPHCLTNVLHHVLVPRARALARANVLNHRLHLSVLVHLRLLTHPPKMNHKLGRPHLTPIPPVRPAAENQGDRVHKSNLVRPAVNEIQSQETTPQNACIRVQRKPISARNDRRRPCVLYGRFCAVLASMPQSDGLMY